MTKIRFSEVPILVKVGVGLALFNTWVLFEETVIDRSGLWEILPLYRKSSACTWDLMAALAILTFLAFASRSKTS
jgi:hypothetical protein